MKLVSSRARQTKRKLEYRVVNAPKRVTTHSPRCAVQHTWSQWATWRERRDAHSYRVRCVVWETVVSMTWIYDIDSVRSTLYRISDTCSGHTYSVHILKYPSGAHPAPSRCGALSMPAAYTGACGAKAKLTWLYCSSSQWERLRRQDHKPRDFIWSEPIGSEIFLPIREPKIFEEVTVIICGAKRSK